MVWNSDQYWKKAVRYAEIASQGEREKWERPFWLSLALEFLARSALTRVHPALNADPEGDGLHILYAFGFELKGQPKSLPIHAVLLRLQRIIPDALSKPRREFCDYFSNMRNQEVHTCDLPFEGLSETKWLAKYYDVCKILCDHLGRDLSELFDDEEASAAERLIGALHAEKLSAVKGKIAAHKKVFEGKPKKEQQSLVAAQTLVAQGWHGRQTKAACPACESPARLDGTIERVSKPIYEDNHLYVKNVVLAHRLECEACGLVLSDIDELHIAEIEPHFEYFEETELHDYHEGDDLGEYDNM